LEVTNHQLRFVIYILFKFFGSVDFRKKPSFFLNPAEHNANLMLSPTKSEDDTVSRPEDYGLKCAQKSRAISNPAFAR
jgi:hypothetical protein